MSCQIMMRASRCSTKRVDSTMAPGSWNTVTLYHCLCVVLLVQVSVLELTSQLGGASLADLATGGQANKLVARRVDKVDLNQFRKIDNDSVMRFHRAQKRSLSADDIASLNAVQDADADADDSSNGQEVNAIANVIDNDDADNKDLDGAGAYGIFARIVQAARNSLLMARRASAPDLMARVSQAAGDAIAPARSYFSVIKRYKDWRDAYNELQEQFGKRSGSEDEYVLANSMDVIRFEYAKLDNDMMSEICHRNIDTTTTTTTTTEAADNNETPGKVANTESVYVLESRSENMDFMWNLMNRLIERLEQKLDELRAKGPAGVLADEQARRDDGNAKAMQEEKLESERQAQVASDRAKRIAAHSLANFAAREFMTGFRLYTFNALATYVSNSVAGSPDNGIMSTIEPIILLLGSTNTPLMVSYLRNIQFRATLNIVSYSLSKLSCPLRGKTPAIAADENTSTTVMRGFEGN